MAINQSGVLPIFWLLVIAQTEPFSWGSCSTLGFVAEEPHLARIPARAVGKLISKTSGAIFLRQSPARPVVFRMMDDGKILHRSLSRPGAAKKRWHLFGTSGTNAIE